MQEVRGMLYCLIILAYPFIGKAQDVHFSQFYNAPFDLNPALTGVFGGDIRFSTIMRNQWSSVPVDYRTVTAAYDRNFNSKSMNKSFFAGGINFQHDEAGSSPLTQSRVALSGSYTQRVSQKAFLTLGGQAGFHHRTFRINGLTFDNQYNPQIGTFDPSFSTGELFPERNNNFFDFATGLNLRIQQRDRKALLDRLEQRNKIDFGIGIFHLNRPNQSFGETENKVLMPIRMSPYLMGTLMLGSNLDLIANVSAQYQGPYKESVMGLAGKIHLNRTPGNQVSLQLGAHVRFYELGDAFFPSIHLEYNSWRIGLSYDNTFSDFNSASRGRGGPEFSLQYIIRKVPNVPQFKICPLI
jgi:type IX secretion system PorP/SprF family membrane protein